MYRKSAIPCERLISSAGYPDNKTRSSLEANTINMLMCLQSWLFIDIWVRKRVCYSLF